MNYIFFGTPEFAAIILEKLINAGFIPEAVVCNPDRPVGRKKIITAPPVKARIMNYESGIRNKIKILQPEKLEIGKNPPGICPWQKWKLEIDKLGGVDFVIVASYSKIIPKTILDSLPAKFIGIHPSLLPKYRGPSPIQTAILNGDKITGATLYLMDEKVDHGPILASRELTMTNDDNYGTLSRKLAELSADLLTQFFGSPTSQKIINVKEVGLPNIELQPQDESQATYTKKFSIQDAYIEPQDLEKAQGSTGASTELSRMSSHQETRRLAIEIDRKIRALNPEPGTWTITNNKRTKLLESKIIDEKLKITKIQVEGKKPQNTCRII